MNIEQKRAEFEAWHAEKYGVPLFDDARGRFTPTVVQNRFEAYQAGRTAPQPADQDDEVSAMEAVMESVDPATWPGLTSAQRCALGRFAKPQPAEPVKTDSAGYTLGPVSDGGMDPRHRPAEPVKPTAPFDDPRVQTVYGIICGGHEPPEGEHWDGYVSRLIVDALFHDEPVKVPSDAEIEALAKEYMFAHAQFVGAGEVWYEGEVEFARALLSRYGQPTPTVDKE